MLGKGNWSWSYLVNSYGVFKRLGSIKTFTLIQNVRRVKRGRGIRPEEARQRGSET